jgi:predicted alpha/beta-hydrolase family hydrolase
MHFLTDGPANARHTFAFAHGAGGAMDTPFMARVASGLAEHGIRVVRFEFPYMAARRTGGRGGAPDRQPVLIDAWRRVIGELGPERLTIAGKSLGGRIATMVADDAGVRAVVCFGYPFHPPGQPGKLRTQHLEMLRTPALILQGTRDPFGGPDDVAGYNLSPAIRVEWLADGDHSLKPRKSSGATEEQHLAHAVRTAAEFIESMR